MANRTRWLSVLLPLALLAANDVYGAPAASIPERDLAYEDRIAELERQLEEQDRQHRVGDNFVGAVERGTESLASDHVIEDQQRD